AEQRVREQRNGRCRRIRRVQGSKSVVKRMYVVYGNVETSRYEPTGRTFRIQHSGATVECDVLLHQDIAIVAASNCDVKGFVVHRAFAVCDAEIEVEFPVQTIEVIYVFSIR